MCFSLKQLDRPILTRTSCGSYPPVLAFVGNPVFNLLYSRSQPLSQITVTQDRLFLCCTLASGMALLDVLVILLISALTQPALCQAPADPLINFCRRYGHQTAVIDRRLYIDGGWLYANPIPQNPVPTISMAATLCTTDHYSDICVDQGLLYDDLDYAPDDMPKQYANLTKNSSVPDVAGGTLWQDEVNKVFWLYGGEFSTAPSAFQLWGYDVILNQWNVTSPSPASTDAVQRVSYGAGVAVSESGKGFYYGGYLNKLTNPLWNAPQIATGNLITYDMDENTLTNSSGIDSIGRAEGTMVFIPASGAGLLIYFGGVTFPYGNDTEVAVSRKPLLRIQGTMEKLF